MKRLGFAVLLAAIFFVLLNFIYCNLDAATFNYGVVFKFNIPYLLSLRSMPIPLGFMLLITFCAGMIASALFEALPSLWKTLELRAQNKKIKALERELTVMRQISVEKRDSVNTTE